MINQCVHIRIRGADPGAFFKDMLETENASRFAFLSLFIQRQPNQRTRTPQIQTESPPDGAALWNDIFLLFYSSAQWPSQKVRSGKEKKKRWVERSGSVPLFSDPLNYYFCNVHIPTSLNKTPMAKSRISFTPLRYVITWHLSSHVMCQCKTTSDELKKKKRILADLHRASIMWTVR